MYYDDRTRVAFAFDSKFRILRLPFGFSYFENGLVCIFNGFFLNQSTGYCLNSGGHESNILEL